MNSLRGDRARIASGDVWEHGSCACVYLLGLCIHFFAMEDTAHSKSQLSFTAQYFTLFCPQENWAEPWNVLVTSTTRETETCFLEKWMQASQTTEMLSFLTHTWLTVFCFPLLSLTALHAECKRFYTARTLWQGVEVKYVCIYRTLCIAIMDMWHDKQESYFRLLAFKWSLILLWYVPRDL